MERQLVEIIAVLSMPGVVLVGVGPALIGAMMGAAWLAALGSPGDLPSDEAEKPKRDREAA